MISNEKIELNVSSQEAIDILNRQADTIISRDDKSKQ